MADRSEVSSRGESTTIGKAFQQELTLDHQTCNLPVRNRANTTRGVNFALLGLVVIFVGLRVISRTRLLDGSGFRWDDFVVALCFAVAIPLHASLELATQNGLGQDTYRLAIDQITEVLKVSGMRFSYLQRQANTSLTVVVHRRHSLPVCGNALKDCHCITISPNMDDGLHQASSSRQVLDHDCSCGNNSHSL